MSLTDDYEKWDLMKEHFDLIVGNPDTSEIHSGDVVTEKTQTFPIGVVLRVEEDSMLIALEGGTSAISVDKDEFFSRLPTCDSCDSEKVHQDSTQEWVCPFCEL